MVNADDDAYLSCIEIGYRASYEMIWGGNNQRVSGVDFFFIRPLNKEPARLERGVR